MPRKYVIASLVAGVALSLIGSAFAQEDSPFRSLMKLGGFAAEPPPPADFVRAARPAGGDPEMKLGVQKDRADKLKTPDELKALQSELEGVKPRHESLSRNFAPAAKAVTEQKAAQAEKDSKAKKKKDVKPTP